jgi:hypothetical protein
MTIRAWWLTSCVTLLGASLASAADSKPATGPASTPPPSCAASGELEPICGLQAPEDLVVLPEGGRLLVVQMRGPTHLPNSNIAELDVATRHVQVLPVRKGEPLAGLDAGCRDPLAHPDLHGFDLTKDAAGDLQLLVVNHGERESIEFFRIVGGGGERALEWRGCVLTPIDVRLNDIAVTPGGGFIATVMGEAKYFGTPDGFQFLVSGVDTGYLLAWAPGAGFKRLPGSDAAFPNGVAVDSTGRTAYFAAWTGGKVLRYDLARQQVTGVATVAFLPDNLSWAPDGSLLTAGIPDFAAVSHCLDGRTAFCTSAFSAVRIDPATMNVTTLVDGPNGVLGGASVAVHDGSAIYIGAWAGDRILRSRAR